MKKFATQEEMLKENLSAVAKKQRAIIGTAITKRNFTSGLKEEARNIITMGWTLTVNKLVTKCIIYGGVWGNHSPTN